MRTVEVDDSLMRDAMETSGSANEQAVVEAALRLFLQLRGQSRILELRGKVEWAGDLEESRLSRFPDWDRGTR